ncbi:hypothetical protein [Nocardia noduli]|uniref:hypothetical protein n=1 Tax=Nocardia noduli TaxID=2815722 RepID=UPI001C234124|nr:hypothetical protein [Nocardia noduli]
MRIIRPDDSNDDDNDDKGRADSGPGRGGGSFGRELTPADFAGVADDVEDYLADVLAGVPPFDGDEPLYTQSSRSARPIGPKRPALHLVSPGTDPDQESDDGTGRDHDELIAAGRNARKRMLRHAGSGTVLVVTVGAVAGWGESVVVTGPLAVYGLAWVGYLWWNAALRPSFPDTVTAISDGISRAVSGALSRRTTPDLDAPAVPSGGSNTAVSVEEVNKPTTDNT